MKHENIYKLTLTALMAALSYVIFTFLQIQITLPGGDATSFHLGNAVCVLGALLVGGVYGGIGGAIGMTIGDLFNPVYVVYAPKTFILKFCIGLITGLIAPDIFSPAQYETAVRVNEPVRIEYFKCRVCPKNIIPNKPKIMDGIPASVSVANSIRLTNFPGFAYSFK